MLPPREGGAFLPALARDLDAEERWLRAQALFSDGARAALLSWLARRLTGLALPCLVAAAAEAPVAPALWERLLDASPVLMRLGAGARDGWRRQVTLLGERLRNDLPGDEIAALEILGSASALPPSAIGLTLASGRRLVYKPRDVRIGAWFMGLCRKINDLGPRAALHVREVRAREGYAWDDFVAAAPCEGGDAIARYFVRAGALLRLLQLLRAVDMHRRNVVAAGEHPAIVDFDGLFRPRRPERSWLERSPYGTGFLPVWVVGEPGRRALNGGGLQRGGDVDETMPLARLRLSEDGLRLEPTYERETSPPTAPASPYQHRERILEGYDDLDAVLARADLRACLEEAAELPVRFFPRPVWTHKYILRGSLKPARVASEELRARYLAERLVGPFAEAERRALGDAVVPIFEVLPGGDAAILPDGTTRPGYFAGRALDALVWEHDRARDRDVIVTALAAGEPPPGTPTAIAAAPRVLDWRAAAVSIADQVIDAGLEVGVAWVPWAGARRLGPLPADILSGSAGIALTLARLWTVTGAARHRDAALRALAAVARAVEKKTAWYGAFIGLGGQLHALTVCGRLLGHAGALTLAARRIATLRDEPGLDDAADDLVGGLAGLAVACPEAWLGDRLLARLRWGLRPPPYPAGDGLPPVLPTLDEGVGWALAQIAARTGDPRYRVELPATPRPRSPVERLELALDAGRIDEARRLAGEIAGVHGATGSWLPESRVADRLHPSAVTGLLAVAKAFLRLAAS